MIYWCFDSKSQVTCIVSNMNDRLPIEWYEDQPQARLNLASAWTRLSQLRSILYTLCTNTSTRISVLLKMADTLREPWICSYLVETGEQYGGILSSVPFREKKKKVQLIEVCIFEYRSIPFSTYPSAASDLSS